MHILISEYILIYDSNEYPNQVLKTTQKNRLQNSKSAKECALHYINCKEATIWILKYF